MATRTWCVVSFLWAAALTGLAQAQGEAGGLEALQGEWNIEEAFKGSEKIPPELAKEIKISIKGDRMTVSFAGQSMEGKVKVDNTKNPRHLDMTVEGMTVHGIYEL